MTAAKTMTQQQFDEHRGLNETVFHGNRFESVVFEGSLEDHTFEDCVFQSCSFNSTSLRHTHFESCKFHDEIALAGTSFRYADLSHATFHQCDLTNSDLSQSKWYDVTISATKAVGLNARGVSNARHINDNTTLHASLISDTQLSFADLSHSDLKASHFDHTRCLEVNWTEADLEGSTLSECDLGGGIFDRAVMTHCDLRGSLFNSINPTLIGLDGVTLTSDQLLYLAIPLGIQVDDS